jgi:para-aminobenzoate synthetase/4-amino-4-deoxychorismate lyase
MANRKQRQRLLDDPASVSDGRPCPTVSSDLPVTLTSASRPSFELLETIRLDQGIYWLLERHLERLAAGARFFGVPLSLPEVRAVLSAHRDQFPHQPRRVRLLIATTGTIHVESVPLPEVPAAPRLVVLAHSPITRSDPFLRYKTTYRVVYQQQRRQHPAVFDVLLWNEQGELTEFTIGNLVVEQAGVCWTPPCTSGLLPGTFRAELLAQQAIHERPLTHSDLAAADRIWLINSVQGWLPVELAGDLAPHGETAGDR